MNTENPDNETKMNVHKVTKTIVTSPHIYKPVGPYSQAILADKTLYVSGVLGMDPQAHLVDGGAAGQARKALENLRHVLEAGGASLESVVKTTILLARMEDFQDVNKVYAESACIAKRGNDNPCVLASDHRPEVKNHTKCCDKGTALLRQGHSAAGFKLNALIESASRGGPIPVAVFPKDCPARATFQVAKLPMDAAVEIEAIALSGDLVVAEAGPCPCAKI